MGDELVESVNRINLNSGGEDRCCGLEVETASEHCESPQPPGGVCVEELNGPVDGCGHGGVPVVGAWRWLPGYGFGVATEVDRDEAFQPLQYPITAFWIRFSVLSAVGLFPAAMCGIDIKDVLKGAAEMDDLARVCQIFL